MGNVLVEKQSLQDNADAIREVTSTENTFKPSEMGNALREFANGLIDQANATTGKTDTDLTSAVGSLVEGYGGDGEFLWTEHIRSLSYLFYKATNLPVEMIINVPKFTSNNDSFYQAFLNASGVEYLKLICENQNVLLHSYLAFGSCTTLKILDLTEFTKRLGVVLDMFSGASSLETILGELNFTNASQQSNTFKNCTSLKEIRIVSGSLKNGLSFSNSSLLSDASIQSIIDGLADLTGQTARTITFHADVKAKLTEEQIATITSKNWTLA